MKVIFALLLLVASLHADQRCVSCHPKEDAGYARTGMARSLMPMNMAPPQPDGAFVHEFSNTRFTIHSSGKTMTQSLVRRDEYADKEPAFAIGSGSHAVGYLVQIGDHIFQSPLAYYTTKKIWDVAPGYEQDKFPDFSRPVTSECLFCHSGKPLPVANTMNTYEPGVFASFGISCERCHGDVTVHLQKPTPGSILNPAKMFSAARASVCEQCHLTGDTRIPNPGKTITDYKPGQALEDSYTTYIAAESTGKSIKVVSHAEQLALSKCALKSGDQMWCGTCHNPHDEPAQPAAYYREKCLSCHAATLAKEHAAAGRDCAGCHMAKMPAKDGGHTAFTNHQILRQPGAQFEGVVPDTLVAWREPDVYVKDRNMGLALVTNGIDIHSPAQVIRGYKILNKLGKQFPNDPELFTTVGLVLMTAKEPAEALKLFQKVLVMKPTYAPYYVNAAAALMALDKKDEAIAQLEKARSLDPLLQRPVQILHKIYYDSGQPDKSYAVLAEYDKAMGSAHH